MEMKDSWKDYNEMSKHTIEVRKMEIWAYKKLLSAAISASSGMLDSSDHFEEGAKKAIKENKGELTDENGNLLEEIAGFASFQESWDEIERTLNTVWFQQRKTVENDMEDADEEEQDDKDMKARTCAFMQQAGTDEVFAVRYDHRKNCTGLLGPLAHYQCKPDEMLDPSMDEWYKDGEDNIPFYNENEWKPYDAKTAIFIGGDE
jgi:hypothetical protein